MTHKKIQQNFKFWSEKLIKPKTFGKFLWHCKAHKYKYDDDDDDNKDTDDHDAKH